MFVPTLELVIDGSSLLGKSLVTIIVVFYSATCSFFSSLDCYNYPYAADPYVMVVANLGSEGGSGSSSMLLKTIPPPLGSFIVMSSTQLIAKPPVLFTDSAFGYE